MNHRTLARSGHLLFIVLACSAMALPARAADAAAQANYESPDAAAAALIAALRADDNAALTAVFGPDSQQLIDSGDGVADANARATFVAAYDTAYALQTADDGSVVLEVGDDGWPLPIPIVQNDGRWSFDTAAGIDEIVYRRIGRNELGAIAVCIGIVAAQQEYASVGHDGLPSGIYAQKLVSDPGNQNGLYWPTASDQRASPVGPFIANATAQGYTQGDGDSDVPYHGYVYKLLIAQGPAAPGGAQAYINNGVADGGFGVIAFPAEYEASGVTTFMINQDGVVYQKDLGSDTGTAAAAIDTFNPDASWSAVED